MYPLHTFELICKSYKFNSCKGYNAQCMYVYCVRALKILKTWSCRISSFNLLKTLPYNLVSKISLHGHINQSNQNHLLPEKSLNSMQITCLCVPTTTMSVMNSALEKKERRKIIGEKEKAKGKRNGRQMTGKVQGPAKSFVLTLQYLTDATSSQIVPLVLL